MLIFKKKKLFNLYIYSWILVFFFCEFSTNFALSKNFSISKIEVEEVYDLNFNKTKVTDDAFKKAFKIMIYKIVEYNDRSIIKNIKINEIKSLIENFSITNEKFINKNYNSEFEVQFNKKKILNFLNNKGVVPSSPNEIKTFIIPVLIDSTSNELFYLSQNIFYKNWDRSDKNHHLIKYVLPNEDIEDYSIIKKNINNIENYNFKEIINKYNLKNEIILIILKSDSKLRVFSKLKFDKQNMILNNIYNLSNTEEEINNIILDIKNDYEDKWKSINKINTSIELPIRISINSKNTKLSENFENKIYLTDLVSDIKIEKFNSKEIIYRIIFNSTPNKFLDIMSLYNFKIDTANEVWKLQ